MSDAPGARSAKPAHDPITVVGVVILAALAGVIFLQPPWIAGLQAAWFDTCQSIQKRPFAHAPVIVVEVDEPSLARYGQWPWPRNLTAELVRAIARAKPSAIGIDILMPEPDRLSPEHVLSRAMHRDPTLATYVNALPSNDEELARAIADAPVVLAYAGTLTPTAREAPSPPVLIADPARRGNPAIAAAKLTVHAGTLANIAELDRAAAGHGLVSAGRADDVVRRVPLVARIGERPVPSLPIEMLRIASAAPDVRVVIDGSDIGSVRTGPYEVPVEADGEMRIWYSPRIDARLVSAADVLDQKFDASRLAGKLVLVSASGLATVDYQNTPLGDRMPGAEIHAQVLENIVDSTWLLRPKRAPPLEAAAFALLGLALVMATPRSKPHHAALLAGVSIAALFAGSYAAFRWYGLVLDAATPAASLAILFVVLLVLTLSEAARQRRRLEQVVQRQREEAAYVDGELAAAQRVQIGFLPREDVLEGDTRAEIAASMTPAREVGGDLYDFFRLDSQRLFFLIGDVAGKGLSASVFMAVSKALVKSATLRNPGATPGELMQAANGEISRDNSEMLFVTAFAGILDLDSGQLAYCNAGHENPFVVAPGRGSFARITDGAGPPLCAVDGFPYRSGSRRMFKGEVLVIVTDGVIDARNAQGARYGAERLHAALARAAEASADARGTADAILADVAAYSAGTGQTDDLTVLALRWKGPAEIGA